MHATAHNCGLHGHIHHTVIPVNQLIHEAAIPACAWMPAARREPAFLLRSSASATGVALVAPEGVLGLVQQAAEHPSSCAELATHWRGPGASCERVPACARDFLCEFTGGEGYFWGDVAARGDCPRRPGGADAFRMRTRPRAPPVLRHSARLACVGQIVGRSCTAAARWTILQ